MRPKSAYEGEQDQSQVTPTPTATILSLPDELLLLIAAIGLEDARLPFGFNWLSPRLEWTMSHVSRRFRNVITSAPTLWTQIEVDLPCPGSAEIFKTYLARSQACKIWVTLRDISQESYQNPIPNLLIHDFVPHINRVQRLSIEAAGHTIHKVMAPLRDVSAASVRRVEVRLEDISDDPDGALEIFCRGAPLLHSISMFCLTIHRPLLPPWTSSLVAIELRCWSTFSRSDNSKIRTLKKIVTACPLLAHLAVDFWPCPNTGRQIEIPSLKSLHLYLTSDDEASTSTDMLSLFATPALTDLVIIFAHGEQLSVLFNPTSLPQSVFPALTSLSFISDKCICEAEDPLRFLPSHIFVPSPRVFPALTSFCMLNVCFSGKIIHDLLGEDAAPWPRLRTFAVSVENNPDYDQTVYAALQLAVRARRQRELPVPTIRLDPHLFCQKYWAGDNVDVEVFDPMELVNSLRIDLKS